MSDVAFQLGSCGNFLWSTVNVELIVIGIAMAIDMLYSPVGQVRRVHDKQPRVED